MVLVVILSVYNGFDNLIKSLYNSYSPNYIIEAAKGKSFTADEALIGKIREQESTLAIAPLVQDNIFCTYNGSQSVATLCGVDSLFLQRSRLADYIVDGSFSTGLGEINGAIVSSKLAIMLGIRCRFTTPLMLYYPKMRRSTAAVTVPIDTHDAPVEPPSGDTDDSARILRAIDRLPVDQAIVIKLRAIEGLDNRQIEAETGFSSDKVRQALCRARRKLKEISQ